MHGRSGLLIVALAAIGVTVLVLVLAAAVTAPTQRHAAVRIEPQVTFALPPASTGCTGAIAQPGGAEKVPMTVSVVAGQVAESVNVCIDGQGPYPFILDSGAGQSTIDAGLAHRLHLASAGAATRFAGVGCTGTAQPVSVGSWSLDGVTLAPQQLTSATLPQMGGKGEPVGLLGSDVLSRFGAIRIDFDLDVLVVPGPEGALLAQSSPYTGPTGPPPPLTNGQSGTTVPLTVTPAPGDVSLGVTVRFGSGKRRDFVVDTGSSASVVSSFVVRAQSLKGTTLAQRQSTVCSVITVPLVHSGSWSVPGLALHPQLIGSTNFGAISQSGTQGLLGSDQLRRYGWVVLDYAGAQMVLGT